MKFKIWIILFFFAITGTNAFAVAEEKTWSFEFKKISVPDALNKISEVSGIDINIDGKIDHSNLYYSNLIGHPFAKKLPF